MNKPLFTCKEICAIIKSCRGLAEIELQIGDFSISYRPQGHGDVAYLSQVAGAAQAKARASSLPPEYREQAETMDRNMQEDIAQAQLILGSPSDFEKAQVDALFSGGVDDSEGQKAAHD